MDSRVLVVGLIAVVVGCDSAQQPTKPRVALGTAATSPPPPPPAPPVASSAAATVRPNHVESAIGAPVTESPALPPSPQGNESTLTADQETAIERADPSKWRTDYFAFRKNVSVVDGKVTWGQMKQFARVFELAHASGEAQMKAMDENEKSKKRDLANKYLQLDAEAKDAIKKLGKLNWTARVLSNPRRRKTPVQLNLPDLPQPARITFLIPEDEEPRWDSVNDGDSIRFRCGLSWGGYPESPELTVHMHLLD